MDDRPKALVVDDEASIRKIVVRTLQSLGYEVLMAESGWTAFEHFSHNIAAIQLIVSDVDMVDGSGIDLGRAVRDVPTTSHIPIIFITGSDERLAAAQAAVIESSGLKKPFTPSHLTSLILTLRTPGQYTY